jgi:hypothetical protein
MGVIGLGRGKAHAARALAAFGSLGLSWCVDCGGEATADSGGFGGEAGAPGEDETKIAVRNGGELWLVEFSDPTSPRSTLLTDHVWAVVPLAEASLSSGAAWSPNAELLAWSNDNGTAGALVDGRVVQAPLEPAHLAPGVHFLDEETVAVHPLTVLRLWEPRADTFRTRVSADVWAMAGAGYVYCQEDRLHFTAASGETVAWDRFWMFYMDQAGEHVALVVPEAGASGLEAPLVSEIVLPGVPDVPVDCEYPLLSGEWGPQPYGPVQWSASGERLGAMLRGDPMVLRVGDSPLGDGAEQLETLTIGSSDRRNWDFVGEEVRFIEEAQLPDVDRRDQPSILKKLAVDGTVSTLGESEPGEWLADSAARAGDLGALFMAEVMNSNQRGVYLLDASGRLSKLADGFLTASGLPVLRPEPDGPGVAVFAAAGCPSDGACIDPETLVWPDPDADPDAFFTLPGDAQWMPGTDGLVVANAGEIFFVRQDEPERLHRLARGEEVLVPPVVAP